MLRAKERGEGKVGLIVSLALLAGVAFSSFKVVPVYFDHYNLVDKMTELARAPRYSHPDERIYELLYKFARENRIDEIQRGSFVVSTVETSRRISVKYHRLVEVLPGWKHDFVFDKTVEGPLI